MGDIPFFGYRMLVLRHYDERRSLPLSSVQCRNGQNFVQEEETEEKKEEEKEEVEEEEADDDDEKRKNKLFLQTIKAR
jgi:ribosomal protein L12E/L44/L45/RPP1/RPP2